jgi:basic membrane protein A
MTLLKRRHSIGAAAAVTALALTLAACGGQGGTSGSGSGATTSLEGAHELKDLKIGLIMGGPKNDDGYYEAGFNGLTKAAEELGVKFTVVENVTPPQAEQTFRDLADAGNELLIGMGADFEDGGVATAPDYPAKQFVVMNGRKTLSNLATYQLREGQSAFLAGYLVSQLQTSGTTFGLIGGLQIPPHLTLSEGLKVAVAKESAGSKLLSAFTGSFTDVALAKEAALAQINNGATVLIPWSGSAVDGVFAAASENEGIQVISPLTDRCGDAPYFVASAVTDPGGLVFELISDYGSEEWKPDGSKALGLETPNVGRVVPCVDVPADVQEKVDEMQKALIEGTVPDAPAGL